MRGEARRSRSIDPTRQSRQAKGVADAGESGRVRVRSRRRAAQSTGSRSSCRRSIPSCRRRCSRAADPKDAWRTAWRDGVLSAAAGRRRPTPQPAAGRGRAPARYWRIVVDPRSGGSAARRRRSPRCGSRSRSCSRRAAAGRSSSRTAARRRSRSRCRSARWCPATTRARCPRRSPPRRPVSRRRRPRWRALKQPIDTKRWLLWSALWLATLVLGWMAWSLSREMRTPATESAARRPRERSRRRAVPQGLSDAPRCYSRSTIAPVAAHRAMSGNTLGTLFCVTSFGESHGPAIGCVVDGCPPGLALAEADIQRELDRRKPGTSRHVTQRRESDTVEILSGVFEGRTTGTPIALLIRNEDARSKDYANDRRHVSPRPRRLHVLAEVRHPRLSRRRPAVGARDGGARRRRRDRAQVAARALRRAHSRPPDAARPERDRRSRTGQHVDANPFFVANATHGRRRSRRSWTRCASRATRCGARIRSIATGVPVGWGEPVYGKLDADLAYAMMGINAVKGVEIGAGFASVAQRGTEHSDEMTPQGFLSNNAGGILGGISTGQDVVVAIAVKPTSSIRLDRRSIDKAGRAGDRQHARPPRSRASAFAPRRSPKRCWRWC